jgi:hypothetical protein
MFGRRNALGRALQLAALALTLFMTSKAFAEQTITVLYRNSSRRRHLDWNGKSQPFLVIAVEMADGWPL